MQEFDLRDISILVLKWGARPRMEAQEPRGLALTTLGAGWRLREIGSGGFGRKK